jgi:hypothetical protein
MTAWGVEAMFFNVYAKLERNENLAVVIRTTRTTRTKYAKALKGIWMHGMRLEVCIK